MCPQVYETATSEGKHIVLRASHAPTLEHYYDPGAPVQRTLMREPLRPAIVGSEFESELLPFSPQKPKPSNSAIHFWQS